MSVCRHVKFVHGVVKFNQQIPSKQFRIEVGHLKAPYSSKIDIFIQESFYKLIYGSNTIIKCGI